MSFDRTPPAILRARRALAIAAAGAATALAASCTLLVDERLAHKPDAESDGGADDDGSADDDGGIEGMDAGCGECKLDHARAGCWAGACVITLCDKDFADCDHIPSNGCEAHLVDDLNNCGFCGFSCKMGAMPKCSESKCQ